jgi:hypothetical protein
MLHDYVAFHDAVALRQFRDWLPEAGVLLDLSEDDRFAAIASAEGHAVLRSGGEPDPVRAARGVACDAILAESSMLSRHLAAEHTIAAWHGLLKPGGRLLLSVESLVQGLARLADQGRWAELADAPSADVVLVPNDDGTISRCFWPEELTGLLDDHGYDVEWVRPRTVLSPEAVDKALRDGATLDSLVASEVRLAAEREGESTGTHLVAAARRR